MTPSAVEFKPNRLRQALRWGLSAALPRRLFLTSGPASSGQVCLTFDDGPHPEHTPRLLDELDRLGVKATFFVVGQEADRHPSVVRRIVASGHRLGNHTWSHRLGPELNRDEFLVEVARTRAALRDLTGADVTLFRPPHGKATVPQLARLWRMGHTVVLWNNDPKDYARQSGADLAAALMQTPPQAGDIVLMHDNRPYAAQALPDFMADLSRRQLTAGLVGDWATRRSRSNGQRGT